MDGEFSPKALRIAREERALSQAALARAMNISQAAVSQVESGVLKPGPEFLRKLVEVLRYPRSFFTDSPAIRPLPVLTYRKQKTLSPTILKAIQARLTIRSAELLRLLASVDVPVNRVPAISIQGGEPSPEEVARELRMRWLIEPGPLENLTQQVEDAGVLVVRAHFGTPKMSGMSDYNPKDGLPPFVFLNADMPADRYRYTLAHELGHLIFHHHLPLPPQLDPCEKEADIFAAELLMPADEIAGDLERLTLERLYALKRYWKVSMHALIHRAVDLEVITAARGRSLYIQLAKLGFKSAGEPPLFEPEGPSLVTEIVQYHINELGYSEEQLGETLRLEQNEMRELYLGSQRRLRLLSSA